MDGDDFMERELEEDLRIAAAAQIDIEMEVDMNLDEFFRQQEQAAPPPLRLIPDAEAPAANEEEAHQQEDAAGNDEEVGNDGPRPEAVREEPEADDDETILTPRGAEMKGLSCMVCYDAFNTKSRIPKVFPCGHTFCIGCIGGLLRARNMLAPSVSCPTCRANTRCSSQTDPKNVATNYSILAMLEQRKEEMKPDRNSPRDLSSCFECNYFFAGVELTMCNHETCQPGVDGDMLKAVDSLKRPKSLLICQACIEEKHSRHNYTPFEKVTAQYEANKRIVAAEAILKKGLRNADDTLIQLGHTKNELMEHRRRMINALENVRDQADHPYIYEYLTRFTENVGTSGDFFRRTISKLKKIESMSKCRYYRSFGLDVLRPLGDVPEHIGPRTIKREPRYRPYEPPAAAGAGGAADARLAARPHRFAAGQGGNRPERVLGREAIEAGQRIDELLARARARAADAAAAADEEEIGLPIGIGLNVLADVAVNVQDPQQPVQGPEQIPVPVPDPAAPAPAAVQADPAAAAPPVADALAGALGDRVLPIVIHGPPGLVIQNDRIAALARMMIDAAVGPGAHMLPAIVQAAPMGAADVPAPPAVAAPVQGAPALPAAAPQVGGGIAAPVPAVMLRPGLHVRAGARQPAPAPPPPQPAFNRPLRLNRFDEIQIPGALGRRAIRRNERRDQIRGVALALQNAIAANPILAEFPDIQNAIDVLNEQNDPPRLNDRDILAMLEDDFPAAPPPRLRRRRVLDNQFDQIDALNREIRNMQDRLDAFRDRQLPRAAIQENQNNWQDVIINEPLQIHLDRGAMNEDDFRRAEIQALVPHLMGMVRNEARAIAAIANIPVADNIEMPPMLIHEGAANPQLLRAWQIAPLLNGMRGLERQLIEDGNRRRARAAQPARRVQRRDPEPEPMQFEEPAVQVQEPAVQLEEVAAPAAPVHDPAAVADDDEGGPADIDRRRAGAPIPDGPAAKRRQD